MKYARKASYCRWLTPEALVVVEETTDAGFTAPEGFEEIERRGYDDTELTFLHSKPQT